MKKFLKFGCLGIIGIFLLLIILGVIFGEEGNDVTNESDVDSEANENQEETNTGGESESNSDKEEEVAVGIGQVLTVGDVNFTVNSVEDKTSLGDQYFNETPTEGAVFKLVHMKIENKGAEALTVDDSFFKLLVNNVEYSPTTSTVMIDDMFFLEQINPNLGKTGILIFEVPQGTNEAQLHVQTGFWGTETGIINLQ